MPLAILLNPADPLFSFEHAMQHREYFAIMKPLSQFSIVPYFIDPAPLPTTLGQLPTPADMWNLDHQRAHDDFDAALPDHWTSQGVGFGILASQNLVDSDLNTPEGRTWWTFVNHQDHYIANSAILPLPTTVNPSPPDPISNPVSPPWWGSLAPAQFPFW